MYSFPYNKCGGGIPNRISLWLAEVNVLKHLKIDFKKRQNAAGCLLKKFE